MKDFSVTVTPSAKSIFGPAARLGTAAQNALEVARFGGLRTDEEPSPYEVEAEHRVYRLRHYHPNAVKRGAAPIVLVPPMMLAAEVYDVSPNTSAVTLLRDNGVDPWVVDFGAPEREEGGLERTLTDHVLAVSDAVDRVRKATGKDVHLSGYSQGGMFCYQTAAYRRNDAIESLITFGSPVDTRLAMPFGLPEQFASEAARVFGEAFRGFALPAWASRLGFRMLDPVKSLRSRAEFILGLHDREALLPREGQRRFLEGEGWVAWPGPAMADFLKQFIAHNRMLEGGFVIEDRLVTLADIDRPVLAVVGTVDQIAPAPGVRAIRAAAPRAEVYELALNAGHFGLVVGSKSNTITWPTVAAWTRWRAGRRKQLPPRIEPMPEVTSTELSTEVSNRVGYGLELAGAVGAGMARSVVGTARRTARSMRELTREAAGQLPKLMRLEQIQPSTRISFGLLLEERRRRGPGETFFLYEDRAYNAFDINERIDNVVRGLIAIGVRRGEHVGVLMGARPTALALVAAISRLGAVAVMLRPDGDVAREVTLGHVERIIADPERMQLAAGIARLHTFVLGGGGGPRDLGVPLTTDMEQIDPAVVTLPKWYRPNPGRASDLAFIVFTGEGEHTRVLRITNRRWAQSAFGTASSAALGPGDTVYSVTPLYHPSGLMMSIGGAVAGGARLALARQFDASTFWEEVRRYGVTVASYTWTLLHDLVNAPPHAGERHHPLRLFIGSGMPRGLWRRVQERFRPARVLEFYASTESGAIIVNVRGTKIGAMGRPLPGSAEVRIARYDVEQSGLILGADGFAEECRPGEVGMLLAHVSPGDAISVSPMRSVFRREDAWIITGDLFTRDSDGDFWLVDGLSNVVHGADGPVFTRPIADALAELPAVDLAVAYGVTADDGAGELAVAAVTLCEDAELQGSDLDAVLERLPRNARPAYVRVVERIPVTTWYRPLTAPLRAEGIPRDEYQGPVFRLERGGRYRRITVRGARGRAAIEARAQAPSSAPSS